ncbi:hypothetical protein PRIO_4176 [Paenibacillus riograndensis SBR5]|uniref:ABC transporter permease n=3 Tax=Paenibacillus riograndensis TaxID=483937 RepID=A0A0E3WI81_9BACL|nr:hypothetical protein PRIO_4176 [Paenibacillus riograndensis SBR5]
MGINPIIKLNSRDVLRSSSYLVMVAMMLIIPLNSVIQILKTNTGPLGYLAVYVLLILNISIYFFLNMLTISMIVISEKTTGRCEYYLANKLEVHKLVKIYGWSSYLLCIGPILIFNIMIFIYALFTNQRVLIDLYLSLSFVFFALAFILFSYFVTSTLTLLSMLSKSPEKIRTYLSVSSVLFIFAATLPGTFLKKLGFTPDRNSLVWIIGSTLLVLAFVCVLIRYALKKKLKNEVVVLSFKQ